VCGKLIVDLLAHAGGRSSSVISERAAGAFP
jgi:hypothetical protein